MVVIIIGNGEIANKDITRKALEEHMAKYADGDTPYVICCDGGARYVGVLGLIPDIIVGDFDSINKITLRYYEATKVKMERHPAEKDFSDMELALKKAFEMGADTIIILGALGGRYDHSLSNIGLLYSCVKEGTEAWLIDGNEKMTAITERIQLMGNGGDILSLIPISEKVCGVTTKGLKYPLNGETLNIGETRGVSNVFESDTAEVSIAEGYLLVALTKEK